MTSSFPLRREELLLLTKAMKGKHNAEKKGRRQNKEGRKRDFAKRESKVNGRRKGWEMVGLLQKKQHIK